MTVINIEISYLAYLAIAVHSEATSQISYLQDAVDSQICLNDRNIY